MVNLIKLAGMAFAITSAAAVDITFRRFAQQGCEDLNHIRKDTHLHDPHCKSFDPNEPAFYSFQVKGEDDLDDLEKKVCSVTVFDQEDCEGTSDFFHDMSTYMEKCVRTQIPGRSVRVSCQEKPSDAPDYHMDFVTVTASPNRSPDTTTVMLYPHLSSGGCGACSAGLEKRSCDCDL